MTEPTSKRIVVYSKAGCPFCSLLKIELDKRGLVYHEIDLTDDKARQRFYANAGVGTMPQLYVTNEKASLTMPSGQAFGGWSDVSKDWEAIENALELS